MTYNHFDFVRLLKYRNGFLTVLWAVVNNAGVNFLGDLEFATLNMFRNLMEVNLFGMVSVTKAFLHLIRKSKGIILIHWRNNYVFVFLFILRYDYIYNIVLIQNQSFLVNNNSNAVYIIVVHSRLKSYDNQPNAAAVNVRYIIPLGGSCSVVKKAKRILFWTQKL